MKTAENLWMEDRSNSMDGETMNRDDRLYSVSEKCDVI
jgi:hypothetical protein